MEIRAYQESDEKDVIKLWFKCDLVLPGSNPKRDIERKLKVDRDLFLVGSVNGKIIASVMGGYEGHRGGINLLAVDPKCRRKGYGRLMMEAVEQRIKEKGCHRINLQVRAANKDVIEFYQAIGYTGDNVVGLGKQLKEDEPYNG
jgi:ribosomal protein S18 acetylase RimI-like enzyme